MVEVTTIKIRKTTKRALDRYREHPAESYDQVIRKVFLPPESLRSRPEYLRNMLRRIDESRQNFVDGEFSTLEEVAERFGIALPPRSQPSSREAIRRAATRLPRTRTATVTRRR